MTGIVVREQSLIERVGTAVVAAIPSRIRMFLEGGANCVVLNDSTARLKGARRRYKSTKILVENSIVLTRRLQIPLEGKSDLRHAINLFVKSVTPFNPNDLLIYADAEGDQAGGALSYTLHMLPRAPVLAALAQLRLPVSSVRSVTIVNEPRGKHVDFVSGLVPLHRWRRWLPALPIVVLLTGSAAISGSRLADLQSQEGSLEAQVSQQLRHVKALTDEVAKKRATKIDEQTVATAFASSPSAFLLLNDVRAVFPPATELLRIEDRADGARFSVRSADVLKDTKTLAAALRSRNVSIEGGIAADPTSTSETAVILIQPRSP